MQPMFSVVDPSKAEQLVKQYREILFPENRLDGLKYMKKAQKMFEKLRNFKLNVKVAK